MHATAGDQEGRSDRACIRRRSTPKKTPRKFAKARRSNFDCLRTESRLFRTGGVAALEFWNLRLRMCCLPRLCALIWVARCEFEGELIIDAKYLQKGSHILFHGKKELMIEGPDGDLWRMLKREVR